MAKHVYLNYRRPGKYTKDAPGEVVWVEVSSTVFSQLQVGKSYKLNGRRGSILAKELPSEKNSRGLVTGRPLVKIRWKDASAIYSKGKFELRSIVGGFAVFVNGKKFDTFPKGAGGEAQGRRRVDELAQQEAEHQAWLKSQGAKDATDVAGVPPDVQRQMIAYLDDHWNESIEKFIAWSKSKGWTEQQARRVWKLVHH